MFSTLIKTLTALTWQLKRGKKPRLTL